MSALANGAAAVIMTAIIGIVLVFGAAIGAVVATVSFVLTQFPHLHDLSIYHIQFWCPYGNPGNDVAKLIWTFCVIVGITVAGLFLGSVLFHDDDSYEDLMRSYGV